MATKSAFTIQKQGDALYILIFVVRGFIAHKKVWNQIYNNRKVKSQTKMGWLVIKYTMRRFSAAIYELQMIR